MPPVAAKELQGGERGGDPRPREKAPKLAHEVSPAEARNDQLVFAESAGPERPVVLLEAIDRKARRAQVNVANAAAPLDDAVEAHGDRRAQSIPVANATASAN